MYCLLRCNEPSQMQIETSLNNRVRVRVRLCCQWSNNEVSLFHLVLSTSESHMEVHSKIFSPSQFFCDIEDNQIIISTDANMWSMSQKCCSVHFVSNIMWSNGYLCMLILGRNLEFILNVYWLDTRNRVKKDTTQPNLLVILLQSQIPNTYIRQL